MKRYGIASSVPRLAAVLFVFSSTFLPSSSAHEAEGHRSGVVTRVVPGSAADQAGLRSGDRIISLADRTLTTSSDLQDVIRSHEPGDVVRLEIERDRRPVELSLRFGERPDGGVSMGLALTLPSVATSSQLSPEEQIGRQKCRSWLCQRYPFEALAQRLDVELPPGADELWSCVERDTGRMIDPMPVGWCDDVFEIHCSGLDVLTELGATLADRCETITRRELDPDPDGEAVRCLRDRTFGGLVRDWRVPETDDCFDALKDCATKDAADRSADPGPGSDESAEAVLMTAWPESGPKILWRRPLGDGYSGIVHEEGRLYTMSRSDDGEVAVALDAASGRTLWRTSYAHSEYRQQLSYGVGPRATPAVAADRLFTAGIVGSLVAFDAADGLILWRRELWEEEELAGNLLSHGYSSSPMVWSDLVILPVGGPEAGLAAFDQATGRTVWTTPGLRNSFSSPILVELAGRKQILAFMAEELVAVDLQTGSVMWRYPHVNSYRHNISVPLVTDEDRVFLSSPEAGARGLRILEEDGSFRVVEEWANRRMQLYHGTSAFDGQRVYGSSGVASPAFLTAIDARTGDIAWRLRGFAKANVTAAGGRLLILDEEGTLALATPSAEGLEINAETPLLDGVVWTAPTLVGETLYARNTEEILAVDLGSVVDASPARDATA